ncbi:MAG: hypothetical protein JXR60_05430 [Bacteroidales bacterium]|nr:hypothetical protein [Bacteroidales bacterium]
MYKSKLPLSILVLLMGALIFGCSNPEQTTTPEDEIDQEITQQFEEDFNQAKQVFYSLPSPIETAMLMKRAGAKYDENLLNPINNIPNYSTTLQKALNLGIYSADLSFVSMFDQSQASIKYLSATKRLADDLGILNAVDQSYITRMENNINSRDSLMEIISETFMNSNAFLKENKRPELAAIVLAGGWVEGLYIATQITKNTSDNQELKDRIIDQRLSLTTLLSLLGKYKDDENVKIITDDFSKIKEIYDNINVATSEIKAVVDNKTNVTTLESTTTSTFSNEDFIKLSDLVSNIRNNYTK